jgi:purine-binding chemotaxis protein CheW
MQSNGSSVLESSEARIKNRAGKYLTFQLAREEYGIGVLHVREIMALQPITAVPQTPADVKGVINLRGRVIPVTDLRVKFGLPETQHTPRTSIVVVQLANDAGQVGVIVDEVCEVVNLQQADIQDTPDFGRDISVPYLLGMAKVKGTVKILLDINRVLDATELKTIKTLLEEQEITV